MTTKTTYLYDAAGIYTSTYEAQESPLEPGVFIMPVDSTTIAPPTTAANECAVFASGAWSIQPDYRGQVIYDQASGAGKDVTTIGPIPAGFALTPPPPTLAEVQATQIATLTSAYQAAIATAVSFKTAAGVTNTYQADPQSVANLQAAIAGCMAAGATPAGFYWVAADNTQVPFAYADLTGLAAAMFAQGATEFQHLQTKKAAVKAATTTTEVQAIVW